MCGKAGSSGHGRQGATEVSELTQCNYCSLNRIKARAKKNNCRVIVKRGQNFGVGAGHDVFVVPNGEEADKEPDHEKNKHFRSWMMRIGSHCEC